MYAFLLYAHSYFRWVVLIAGVVTVVFALRGAAGNRAWTDTDRKVQLAYTMSLSLQFLLGVLLYVVSPIVRSGLADFGASMKVAPIRFFLIEHLVLMTAAVAVAHIFTRRTRRAADGAKQRTWRVGALVSVLLLLAAVPWPFLSYGRPLFRM